MKFRKASIISLVSALLLLISVTSVFAMTEAKEMPDGTIKYERSSQNVEIVNSSTQIFESSNGKVYEHNEDGKLIEIDPEKIKLKCKVEKYTAEEYEKYMIDFIDNHNAYMAEIKESKYFAKTEIDKAQRRFEDTLEIMKKQLESIKSGKGFVSKPIQGESYLDEDGKRCYSTYELWGDYGESPIDVSISIGIWIGDKELGPFDTVEEFLEAREKYLKEEIEAKRMTHEEAERIRREFEEQINEQGI
ncbi:hypothetical protein [Vallitalea maricola]|uniref:Uncharacterized protein n=1 Tax=Vallitalea maricola TaxID=3074433 RepID=A0ACB5UPI0_9FIRM|nr:hypothetical protein AN2V17_36230 [Vallitalea sp. AN17-2]